MKESRERLDWLIGLALFCRHVSPLAAKVNYSRKLLLLRHYHFCFNIALASPFTMVLEDQRFIHEDLERLEQAIADRVAEDPRNVSDSNPSIPPSRY